MREIRVSDITMKRAAQEKALSLSFKEKLELAKQLDNLGVSVIEIEGIGSPKADMLRIKSIASLVKGSALAVPVALDGADASDVMSALAEAAHPRLQVQAAVSPAQMEYIYHKKADAMIDSIASTVSACAAICDDVEFIADDATRADFAYLQRAIEAAAKAGATTITVCDAAGTMFPEEFTRFVERLKSEITAFDGIALGVSCSDELFMAESNAVAAIAAGADEIKCVSYPLGRTSLSKIAKILSSKEDACQARTPVRTTQLKRSMEQIARICEQGQAKSSLFTGVTSSNGEGISLTIDDTPESIAQCVAKLGYELSDEDMALVYESFERIAAKKESIDGRELDAIVASAALQVPPTYTLKRYVINSGNVIKATATIAIETPDGLVEEVSVGDGPIDAAFAALEKVIGRSFELDDWQMQSVTQGQEAMGEAVIKLMANGKLYSGRGISTDIIGSSIRAYINALNKIVYEEGERA